MVNEKSPRGAAAGNNNHSHASNTMTPRIFANIALLLAALSPVHAQPAPATQPAPAAAEAPALDTKNWRVATRWQLAVERAVYSPQIFTRARGTSEEEFVFQTSEEVVDARAKNLVVNPFRENRISVAKLVTFKTSDAEHTTQHTLVLLAASDFTPLRLDVTSADLSGDTFKQFINQHGRLDWHQFSCMPDEGHKTGSSPAAKSLVFENALPLMLRAYPFEGDHRPMKVLLLPDQAAAGFTPVEPVPATIAYEGTEDIDIANGLANLRPLNVLLPLFRLPING
jgi:hypothetical protein